MSESQLTKPEFITPGKSKNRANELKQFADYILHISKIIDMKLSSRGWCYQLEGFNVINKGEFNRIQKLINTCRKQGYLPIDFVAEDKARKIEGGNNPTKESEEQTIWERLQWVIESNRLHDPDFWKEFEYYIVMLVEKIDLITLFEPVCKKYYIKIGNTKGWSSILQRAEIAEDFKFHEEEFDQTPVILYCGDLDPFGEAISDKLKKNFRDIQKGTGWNPKNLIVDRFGTNKDFVDKHNITWIDNLLSGTGKQPDKNNPIVQKYIAKYGERKVEANAIIIVKNEARKLCQEAIEKYLGVTALKVNQETLKRKDDYFEKIMTKIDITDDIISAQLKIQQLMAEENIAWVKKKDG